MLRMLAGSVLTPAKLADWGYKVDTICPRCGQEDTIEHRLLECPAGEELREPIRDMDPELRTKARCILAAPALPPFGGHLGQYRMLAGEFVKGEPFFLEKFGPVYVDGSVVDPTSPLARAAFAALQIYQGKVVRAVIGTVSPDLPQTSDVAEHLAIVMVSELAAAGGEEVKHVIISDCASAVRSFTVGGRVADHHASPHAGFWRDVKRQCIKEVIKVKAHLTRDQAEARGEGHMWEGNYHVDILARDAARAYDVTDLTPRCSLVTSTTSSSCSKLPRSCWPSGPCRPWP